MKDSMNHRLFALVFVGLLTIAITLGSTAMMTQD